MVGRIVGDFFFFKDSFVYFVNFLLTIERVQNIPPPNLPLWQKEYFELKATEKVIDKNSALPSLPGSGQDGRFLVA